MKKIKMVYSYDKLDDNGNVEWSGTGRASGVVLNGLTWKEFIEKELQSTIPGRYRVLGCDMTPDNTDRSGFLLLLGCFIAASTGGFVSAIIVLLLIGEAI